MQYDNNRFFEDMLIDILLFYAIHSFIIKLLLYIGIHDMFATIKNGNKFKVPPKKLKFTPLFIGPFS